MSELAQKPWWREYGIPRVIESSMLEKTVLNQTASLHTSLKTALLLVKLGLTMSIHVNEVCGAEHFRIQMRGSFDIAIPGLRIYLIKLCTQESYDIHVK